MPAIRAHEARAPRVGGRNLDAADSSRGLISRSQAISAGRCRMTLATTSERLLYCGRFSEVSVNASGVVRLVLKTDTFVVDVLPALGGKIASMRKNGIELLQQPLLPYGPRTLSTAFESSDASGFDECLPSVSACDINTPSGKVAIPDHGEFWRLPCEIKSQTQHEI